MSNLISMDKQYRTRDGRAVEVLKVDMNNPKYPVVVIVTEKDGSQEIRSRTSTGLTVCNSECASDLIEVKPRIKRDVWVNVYPENSYSYASREKADGFANNNKRIACVKVTIDCEHGEGL